MCRSAPAHACHYNMNKPEQQELVNRQGQGALVDFANLPGVRCPECQKKGVETWVIRGRACPVCRHECL
ncbi:hypothetical protein SMACR_05274 [Sordaria macrospora]|uniref:Uncharacterized protein n=1 Tax=Sordaria macrospora TaxID=5147 RepID=A0A8S9A481_SORMA|nr:hypothetical protein SMACR_05274 [Sordaria macrospora]WPJ57388.1 hypothetical protein SMAC4_05274 [Sordaria macrospora]